MKVLLIQAGMPELRRPYDVVEGGQLMMPLGMGYLAAVLKEKGVEVKVRDYLAEKFDFLSFKELINAFKPDIIGISSLTATYNQAVKIARLIKDITPLPVVMGGLHVTFLPEEALKEEAIDFVVRGEGEMTLSELIDYLKGLKPITSIVGLSFKDKDKVIHNPDRREIEELDSLPYPDWSVFERRFYQSPLTGELNIPIIFGRGCPYGCNYCSVGGKKRRERKAEKVISEFRWMAERFNSKKFIVTDDLHLLDGEFRKIMELLAEKGLGLKWKMTNRLDQVERKLFWLMKKAGCQAIGYGLESPKAATLSQVHKNISVDPYLNIIRQTGEAGINAAASFMFGFPWEKEEDIKETIRFSADLPLYSICYNLVAYFPGTKMLQELLAGGKVTLKDFNWDDFTLHKATFPTPYLSREELDELLEKAYDYFYFRKVREDLKGLIKNLGDILKKGDFSYGGVRNRFPAMVKAGSFYHGELLKSRGLGKKMMYLFKIFKYLIIPPDL